MHLLFTGLPALYPFLDFQADPGTALVILAVAAVQLPLIHHGFCKFAEYLVTDTDSIKTDSNKKEE